MVFALCRGMLRDRADAEDAAQQSFLSAQRAIHNGSDPREPAAWLATIARNECIGRVRERMREALPTDVEPAGSGADSHAAALRREEMAELRAALESLPEQQRRAIVLRELRGFSYDEVAATLSLTPSAVESVIFRARRGLQLRMRGAAAALSPLGWLGPVRDLLSRLAAGSGTAAAPLAVKAVATGVGAAVVAGGAVVAPHVLGSGRAHRPLPQRAAHVQAPPPAREAAAGSPSSAPERLPVVRSVSRPHPRKTDVVFVPPAEAAAKPAEQERDATPAAAPERHEGETAKEGGGGHDGGGVVATDDTRHEASSEPAPSEEDSSATVLQAPATSQSDGGGDHGGDVLGESPSGSQEQDGGD